MTDQLQTTRDQWTPPTGTPEHTDQDRTGTSSSTQDSTAQESTNTDRPADDGTVYRSAGYDTAVDQPDVHESVADWASNQREPDYRSTEHPAGESLDPVDGSVQAGQAYLDHAAPDHAVGVASVPDADPAADAVDRGAFDAADVAAQDDVRTDAPHETYGLDGPADTPAVAEEPEVAQEHDGVSPVTDTGQPVHVDERADAAGGETPIVPVPRGDAASVDITDADETLPGDLPEEPGLALFDSETTQRFRDRWHELQLRFVDDPHFAEGQAVALVDEVVTALRDAVDRQRSALHDWQAGQGTDAHTGDTERMRVAVRRYRDFLDHLLGV
jgi:hypothetical protein